MRPLWCRWILCVWLEECDNLSYTHDNMGPIQTESCLFYSPSDCNSYPSRGRTQVVLSKCVINDWRSEWKITEGLPYWSMGRIAGLLDSLHSSFAKFTTQRTWVFRKIGIFRKKSQYQQLFKTSPFTECLYMHFCVISLSELLQFPSHLESIALCRCSQIS